MKVLTTGELAWVNVKLATYPISYIEIYNEIADHVLSAIEDVRIKGDERDIEVVFNEVMAFHFPGEKAISKIVLQHVFAFNRKIRQMMWANFTYYLSWPVILLIIIIMVGSFYLPLNKDTAWILNGVLLVLALMPQEYALYKLPKILKIRVDPSKSAFVPGNLIKRSLKQTFVRDRSWHLMLIYLITNVIIGPFVRKYHINFLNPMHYHPAFNMALIVVFILYGLSVMRLCRQEFKIADCMMLPK